MSEMDCRDVQGLADLFVADELSDGASNTVRRHLESCAECRNTIGAHRRERSSIKTAFDTSASLQAPAGLAERLRDRLREDATHRLASPRPRTWTPTSRLPWIPLGAAAAVLLVLAAAGLITSHRRMAAFVQELAIAAVGDHRLCNVPFRLPERPIDLEEAAARYGPSYRIYETVPAATIPLPPRAVYIVGRHVCEYEGRRFVHLVIRDGSERLSLLITDDELVEVRRRGTRPQVQRLGDVGGLSVVSFRAGTQRVFVTGAASAADLEAIAAAVAPVIDEALAGI